MPKTSDMKNSKFLKKEDVGFGTLLTITACLQENVAQADDREELKWTLSFVETPKPLVLNATNIQLCEQIFKSDNTDDWLGKQLVAFTDPNVQYGGKLIGGIRVRAVRVPQARAAAPPPPARTLGVREELPPPLPPMSAPPPDPLRAASQLPPADALYDDDIPF